MKFKVVFVSVFFIILFFSYVSADVPKMINYQGKLTTPKGKLIDEVVSIVFTIYDSSTDGTALWTETQDSVTVDKGIFSVLLGSVEEIPDSVFDGDIRYLGIKVEDDSEMTPRKAIVSVGYAYKAEYADTSDYAQVAVSDGDWTPDTSGINIYRLTGNVGIGTPSPQGKLDLNGSFAIAGDEGMSGQVLTSQGAGTNPVWSEVTAVPGDNSVSQSKLKTSLGEVSASSLSVLTLPGGTYGFYPQIKVSGESGISVQMYGDADNLRTCTTTTYTTFIELQMDNYTTYVQQRYITSSGRDHWIFLLIAKKDFQIGIDPQNNPIMIKKGTLIASYQASDHPCYGNGGDENDIPHPFGSYDQEKHEVILIDNEILPELKSKVTSRRSLLTIINEEYEIDFDSEPIYQPMEIIEIDEYGDKKGEILQKIETAEWAKILIGKDEIYLKRRLVESLPDYISYKRLKTKSEVIAESPTQGTNAGVGLEGQSHTR